MQIYGQAVDTLIKARHLVYDPPGVGLKQLKIIRESIQVKNKEVTQAVLESLEVFKYDKVSNRDAFTKG